jgi:dipeptidyl aminopeptidase/acylaminoacyl peptidase
MEPDASGQTRLTRNPNADSDPAWSPDGARLVFTSNRDGNDEIYVMNADGRGQTRLTTSPGSDSNPTWSPGGRNIAFASRRDGQAEIYVMNEDGTGQTRLTTNSAPDAVPSWSPDGSRIAFTSARDGQDEIYVMNVDGSSQARLTTDPGSDVSPNWSPDGRTIAFASNRDGNYEIYVMRSDGSSPTRLTRNLETDLDPAWSPDGTAITFTSNRDSNYEIYRIDADGTAQSRLTTASSVDTTPDWQPVLIRRVASAVRLGGRWRESTYRGVLTVDGRVDGPVQARLTLRKGQTTVLGSSLSLVAGGFHRELDLPRGLLPGDYVVDVLPDAASGYAGQELPLRLTAPVEGVVSRAWASPTLGGAPVGRLPRKTSIVYASFRFATKPNPGLPVTMTFVRPDGRLTGPPKRKPASALVVGGVRTNGAPLPAGTWRCILRVGPTVVARLRFRIG